MNRNLFLFVMIFFLFMLTSCSNLFNNPPVKPYSPEPANMAENLSKSIKLSWECFDPDDDDLVYNIYFGKKTLELLETDYRENEYFLNNLDGHTTYKWRIVAKDAKGKTKKGDIWTFTTTNTPPSEPSNPFPQDNTYSIPVDSILSWNCDDQDEDSLSFDIYLGKSENLKLIASDYQESSLYFSELQNNTKYYWKVKARDGKGGITTGPIWTFTTKYNGELPGLIKESGPSEITVESSNTFIWKGVDPEGEIVTYEYRKDGENWINNKLTNSYIWNIHTEGEHTFEVRAKDNNGNYSNIIKWSFDYQHVTMEDYYQLREREGDFKEYREKLRKYENLANIKAALPSTITKPEDFIEVEDIDTHNIRVKNKTEDNLVLEFYIAGLLLKESKLKSLQVKDLTVPWDGTEYEILIKKNNKYISNSLSFTTTTSEITKKKGLFFDGSKINEKVYGAYPQYVDYMKNLKDFKTYSMMLHGIKVKVLYSDSYFPFDSKEKEEQFLYDLMISFHRVWYYFGGYPYTSYEFIFLPAISKFPERMNDELPAGVLFTSDIIEETIPSPLLSYLGSICEAWFPCTFFKDYVSETVWIHKGIYNSCALGVAPALTYWYSNHTLDNCKPKTNYIALADAWNIYLDKEDFCALLCCYHKPQPIIRMFTVEYMKNSGNDAIDFYRKLYTEMLLNNRNFDSNDINTLPLNITAEEFKKIIIKLTQNEELVNDIYETYVDSGSPYKDLDIDLYKSKNLPQFFPKWEGEEILLKYYDEVLYDLAKDIPEFDIDNHSDSVNLLLEIEGNGKIYINGSLVSEGTHEFKKGKYLEGDAVPAAGWEFSHWLLNDSMIVQDNPLGQLLDESVEVKAVFIKKEKELNQREEIEEHVISLTTKYDSDGDFLPDFLENEIGTDSEDIDSDNDGLTDYDEYTKYLTDPLNDDSDNDGIIDSDWNERREFSYNLRVVINITYPYYLNTDHYHFTDIRKLSSNSKPNEPDNTDAEVIIYPNSYEIIHPKSIKERDYSSFDESINPNIWLNFDEQMGSDVVEKYGHFKTDWEALKVISNSKSDFDIVTNFKGYDTPPINIDVYYKNGETRFLERGGYSEIDDPALLNDFVEFCLNYNILGRQMFYNGTRRHCGSTANLLATMYRSIGLPCKITQTTILGEKNQKTINMINNEVTNNIVKNSLINSLSPVGCVMNHFIATPLIDRRWIESESKFEEKPKYCIVKPSYNLYNVRLQLFSHPEEAEYYIWAQKQDEGNFHLVEMIEIDEHLLETPTIDKINNDSPKSTNSDKKFIQQMETLFLEIEGKGKIYINDSLTSEGTHEFKKGEYLEGHAVPAAGWKFSHWLLNDSITVQENPVGQSFYESIKVKAIFIKKEKELNQSKEIEKHPTPLTTKYDSDSFFIESGINIKLIPIKLTNTLFQLRIKTNNIYNLEFQLINELKQTAEAGTITFTSSDTSEVLVLENLKPNNEYCLNFYENESLKQSLVFKTFENFSDSNDLEVHYFIDINDTKNHYVDVTIFGQYKSARDIFLKKYTYHTDGSYIRMTDNPNVTFYDTVGNVDYKIVDHEQILINNKDEHSKGYFRINYISNKSKITGSDSHGVLGYLSDKYFMASHEQFLIFPDINQYPNILSSTENIVLSVVKNNDWKLNTWWETSELGLLHVPSKEVIRVQRDKLSAAQFYSFDSKYFEVHTKNIKGTLVTVIRQKTVPINWAEKLFEVYAYLVNVWGADTEYKKYNVMFVKDTDLIYSGEYTDGQGFSTAFGFGEMIVHQIFHRWNGWDYSMNFDPGQYHGGFWSEGINEFYCDKALFELGYVNNYNRPMQGWYDYYNDIYGSNIDCPILYFANYKHDNYIPYGKGAVVAYYIDKKLKEYTNNEYSLDDVLKHFWTRWKEEKKGLSYTELFSYLRNLAGDEYYQDIMAVLIENKRIVLPEFE